MLVSYWVDDFDANHKLWKVFAYENGADAPTLVTCGSVWPRLRGICRTPMRRSGIPWASPLHRGHWLNGLTLADYQNGGKCGSSAGLMEILR
jgi:hypothetical protein